MSVNYVSIGWNRQKKLYDFILFILILLIASIYIIISNIFYPNITFETLIIRSAAIVSILLLHIILSIGPLCRINNKFLPLLYNRRHLGVTMFLIASIHAIFSLIQFHGFSKVGILFSLLTSNTSFYSYPYFPFQLLGFIAYIIFLFMAVTSHDFWLKNLSPLVWKYLHMMVYAAYLLIVCHVLLGIIQYETSPLYFSLISVGSVWIIGIHLYASFIEKQKLIAEKSLQENEFLKISSIYNFQEGRAKIFIVKEEKIAVYLFNNKLYAIHNVCKHQGGPLGEGKIVDGCITCPWHGYQYLPHNGQSPPPFTEKVSTYLLKVENNNVFINPNKLPEGTETKGVYIN